MQAGGLQLALHGAVGCAGQARGLPSERHLSVEGAKENSGRGAGDVQQACAMQRSLGDAPALLDTAAPVSTAEAQPPETAEKRDYAKWSLDDERQFYAHLAEVAGQKPEACCAVIACRLGTKEYHQVRDYYYRLLKRLNKILGPDGKLNDQAQVHKAMLKYWELHEPKGGIFSSKPKRQREQAQAAPEEALPAAKRAKAAQNGEQGESPPPTHAASAEAAAFEEQTCSRSSGPRPALSGAAEAAAGCASVGGTAPVPAATRLLAQESIRTSSLLTSAGKAGERLRLSLTPLSHEVKADMERCGYNPFLDLTLSSSKSLASVLRHLGVKWQRAVAPGGGGSSVLVHPACDCPIPLQGMSWGGAQCDARLTVGDIYVTLQCPAPFQLLYSWQPAVTSPAAQLATPVPFPTLAQAPPLPVNIAMPRLAQPPAAQAVLRAPPGAAVALPARTLMQALMENSLDVPEFLLPAAAPMQALGHPFSLQPSRLSAQQPAAPAPGGVPWLCPQAAEGETALPGLHLPGALLPACEQQQRQQQQQQQQQQQHEPAVEATPKPRGLLGLLKGSPALVDAGTAKPKPAKRKPQKKHAKAAQAAPNAAAQPCGMPWEVTQLQAMGMPLPSGMAQYLHPFPPALHQAPQATASIPHQALQPPSAAPAALAGMGANTIIAALQLDPLQAPGISPGAKPAAPAADGGGASAAAAGFASVGGETLDALRLAAEDQGLALTTPGKAKPAAAGAEEPSLLRGWTCMSPPPNFHLPDDFAAAASPAVPPALQGPGAGSELSRLVGMALPASLMAFPGAEPAAGQPPAPAAAVLQKGVDALFQQMSYAAAGSGGPGGNNVLPAEPLAKQAAEQPVVPARDIRLAFGSLLGDGKDSQTGGNSNSNWMEPFVAGQWTERGGAEQAPQAAQVGSRPFSSLFGK